MADFRPPAATPGSFAGRTVIVSGGAGCIGKAICLALGHAGANVVVNDINEDAVNDLVSTLKDAGNAAVGVTLSATSGDEIVKRTIEAFGSVHAVVNSTLGTIPWGAFENSTDNQFRDLFEANVLGPLALTRAVWPYFKAQKFGRVVNFTSDSVYGMPGGSTYTMTKGALFGINKSLALEGTPHNIKANCVSPISYRPSQDRFVNTMSEDAQHLFRTRYTAEGNVPMILALVSEACQISGEVFSLAGCTAGRNVYGVARGENEMRTVEECLQKMDALCQKNSREVYESGSMADFTEYQAKYVLGK